MIEVIRPGLLTTIQDLGRIGYAHLGVSRSGALDVDSLIEANRLVGNVDSAAGLETTLNGVTLRAEVPVTMAVTGAAAPITVDGQPVAFGAAMAIPAGATLEIGPAQTGVRSYLAFGGGITVVPVLGSRSTDTLSGLGPPPLRAGFVLPLGRASRDEVLLPFAVEPAREVAEVVLRLRLGPRQDWLSQTARDALPANAYTLSVKTNRVGARLAGPVLTRSVAGELPSEAIVLGAVQVTADGQPLVFLADHPTTGGYPVIGVVERADLRLVAQARPGAAVRFVVWT